MVLCRRSHGRLIDQLNNVARGGYGCLVHGQVQDRSL